MTLKSKLSLTEVKLPSNKTFGFFFSLIFSCFSAYMFFKDRVDYVLLFLVLSLLFFVISLLKADVLLPLNRLWMQFGLLLGMVISPFVLGLLFFGLFTPISFFLRLFKRDELRLRTGDKKSYWVQLKAKNYESDAFKYQF